MPGGMVPETVQVELRGPLARYAGRAHPDGRIALPVGKGVRVEDVLLALAIPPAQTGLLVVNGKKICRKEIIQPGDVLVVFPPVAGG
ncbi:MoaD/ThiS family protein [Desulfurispora thermophila]|uniref:MoaD/ThiS family protein n=1 Tax=Desulfurispora thermophila TaxID=265470 RepID=UPI0014614DDD|nr:MoaD/ThiS family protein [Desulfurispora thermophila]